MMQEDETMEVDFLVRCVWFRWMIGAEYGYGILAVSVGPVIIQKRLRKWED